MNLIDLHCHFLPGVDDGPANLEQTVQLLKAAYQGGTRTVAATPHMFMDMFGNEDSAGMLDHFRSTVQRLAALSAQPENDFLNEMEFFPGAENFVGPSLFSALRRRQVVTLGQGRYLLVEFPPSLAAAHFMPILRKISRAGYVPVLAHIERYQACRGNKTLVREFLDAGYLTQINASSLAGNFLSRWRSIVWKWLKEDLVSVIASDGHGTDMRSPALGEAYRTLAPRFSREKIESWLVSNPRWILSSPRLDSPPE